MTIEEHAEQFAGKPVKDYDPATGIKDPTGVIYRLALSWEAHEGGEKITDLLAAFLEDPAVSQVPGIVIGCWNPEAEGSEPVVEALVAARDKLANLRALFLGDIVREEQEISWIRQSDVSPLFSAYPRLEHFRLRGSENLSLGTIRHDHLRSLVIESGGLGAAIVREVCAAHLPQLEHLELWLGTPNYGGDATIEDLQPLLSGRQFPSLRYLGLRNSETTDGVAAAVATAPVLERIKVLDLSLGNLTDQGAQALLASSAVARLEKLDIHHHYVSEETVQKLRSLGPTVNADDRQKPDEHGGEIYRYIAVSE